MKVLNIINDFGLDEIKKQRLPIPNIDYITLFELVTHPKFAKPSLNEEIIKEDIDENYEECLKFNEKIVEIIRHSLDQKEKEDHYFQKADIDYEAFLEQKQFLRGTCRNYKVIKELLQHYYTNYAMLSEWRENSRQIYLIDKDFMEELAATRKIKIYPKLYKNLPYSTFVLSASDESEIFFVSVIATEDCLKIIFLQSSKSKNMCTHGSEMVYALEEGKDYLDFDFKDEGNVEKYYAKCIEDIPIDTMLLQFCTYLISEKPDVSNIREPKKSTTVNKEESKDNKKTESKIKDVQIAEVGYRYGKAIKLAKKEEMRKSINASNACDDNGIKEVKRRGHVRPYMRCAHWHSYWTGKKDGSEERKIIVKWLPPTYCSGIMNDIVIRKVSK